MSERGWNDFLYTLGAAILLAVLLAVLALAGVGVYLGVRAAGLIRDADYAAQNANRTAIVLGAAATSVQKGLADEQKQESQQLAQAARAESSLADSADALNGLVRHTDASLNDPNTGLLPGLAEIPAEVAPNLQSLQKLQSQAGDLIADTRVTNGYLATSIQNFDLITGELASQLPPVLVNMQKTSANVADISATSKDTSAQIDGSAADLHAWIHRETAPARGTWNFIKGILFPTASTGANIAAAAK